MRYQDRDWQTLSHFSRSLTQQETALHRSTIARRGRYVSARGGRSTRRRYIGAQLLIEVAVGRRGGSQHETAFVHCSHQPCALKIRPIPVVNLELCT